jgi:hypothetical protein
MASHIHRRLLSTFADPFLVHTFLCSLKLNRLDLLHTI